MEKFNTERNDAIASLWLIGNTEIDMDATPTIFFPIFSSEDVTLAKAVYNIIQESNSSLLVIMEHFWTFLLLNAEWFNYVRVRGEPIFAFKGGTEVLWTNIKGFAKYTDNKLFTGIILRASWLPVPQELAIRQSRLFDASVTFAGLAHSPEAKATFQAIHDRTFARVMQFLDAHKIEKFVTKPHDWRQGDGVLIRDREDFSNKWAHDTMFGVSDVSEVLLVQEKIEPYRLVYKMAHGVSNGNVQEWLEQSWQFSDWNMRVLVTYDASDMTSWKYITAGIVCRIDQADKPVNISLGASYDSFESVMEQCWLGDEKEELRKRVEDMAILATESIVAYCDKKSNRPANTPDHQVLVWVDIILDRNKNPIIIEVNDMNSGCNYELMKLEWIQSLYPIARAILGKAHLNMFIRSIKAQVLKTHGPEWLKKIIDGTLKLEMIEEDE